MPPEEALDLWALAASLQVCAKAITSHTSGCFLPCAVTIYTGTQVYAASAIDYFLKGFMAAQMPEIQRRCERVIAGSSLESEGNVERALSLTRCHRDSGALTCLPCLPLGVSVDVASVPGVKIFNAEMS